MTPEQERALALARAQRRRTEAEGAPVSAASTPPPETGLDDYYSSGIYAGSYNPLGAIARSLDAATTGSQNAMSFGFADELTGMLPGDATIDAARARANELAQSNPVANVAGNIAGGVALGGGLSRAGLTLTNPGTQSLLARVAAGAADGGIAGGLYGLGSGEGTSDRAKQALIGALIGGATGGAIPLIAEGGKSVYRSIKDSRAVKEAAKKIGVDPDIIDMLKRTMAADGTLGSRGASNMAAAGDEAMLADAGPNARAVLDTAIQRGGPGAVTAREAIEGRAARSAQDITDALDTTLGKPEGVTAARSAIRTGSAGARSGAYEAAYAAPINYSDPKGMALEAMIKQRVTPDIISSANKIMRLDGDTSRQILAKIADDGTVAFETLPDVRQLDYITRALNQAAESGEGAGALGGQTTLGRAYQGLSREIRDTLRDLVPEYNTALATAADPIRRSQAVELGSKILSPSMARDEVAEAVKGMTDAERKALAGGLRSKIDDALANVSRTVMDGDTPAREAIKAIKDMSSRASREKVEMVIGKDAAAKMFEKLDQAARSFDLRAGVADNSKTFARLATDKTVRELTEPGAIGTAMQGKPVNAMQRMVQAITGMTPEKIAGRQDAIYSNLAKTLTRAAGDAFKIQQGLSNLAGSQASNALIADRIARAILQGGRPAVYPSSVLLQGRSQ